MLARKRLTLRLHPLWWADVVVVMGAVLMTLLAAHVYFDLAVRLGETGNQETAKLIRYAGQIFLICTPLVYLAIVIDCLLPNRRTPDNDVFD